MERLGCRTARSPPGGRVGDVQLQHRLEAAGHVDWVHKQRSLPSSLHPRLGRGARAPRPAGVWIAGMLVEHDELERSRSSSRVVAPPIARAPRRPRADWRLSGRQAGNDSPHMETITSPFTLGEPQTAGPLAVFPVFGPDPRLDYRSFAAGHRPRRVRQGARRGRVGQRPRSSRTRPTAAARLRGRGGPRRPAEPHLRRLGARRRGLARCARR